MTKESNSFKGIIASIRRRPGMYSATGDLEHIRSFLNGYFLGLAECDSADEDFVLFHEKFHEFVDKKFSNNNTMVSWPKIISAYCSNDQKLDSVQEFCSIVDEFLYSYKK